MIIIIMYNDLHVNASLFLFRSFVWDVPFCRRRRYCCRYLFIRSMGKLCVNSLSKSMEWIVCGVRAPESVCDCDVWYNVSAYLNSFIFGVN